MISVTEHNELRDPLDRGQFMVRRWRKTAILVCVTIVTASITVGLMASGAPGGFKATEVCGLKAANRSFNSVAGEWSRWPPGYRCRYTSYIGGNFGTPETSRTVFFPMTVGHWAGIVALSAVLASVLISVFAGLSMLLRYLFRSGRKLSAGRRTLPPLA